MKFRSPGDHREFEVEVIGREQGVLRIIIDGKEVRAEIDGCADGSAVVRIDGRRIRVAAARVRDSILVASGPAQYEFVPLEGRSARAGRGLAAPEVTAPMPGKVLKILVAEGEAVEDGQPLVVLEAMKMETTLYAESAAMVKKIRAAAGDMVDHGAVLVELGPIPAASTNEAPARGD